MLLFAIFFDFFGDGLYTDKTIPDWEGHPPSERMTTPHNNTT
jgi:hypothetical protein